MARKSLFLGLTGMLVVVLVYLVVQGRKQEKAQQQNPRPVEIIRESKPTPTRIIAPSDLRIVESMMDVSPAGKGSAGEGFFSARHEITIRNEGKNTYRNLRLRLSYLGHNEKVLETRNREIDEILQPGEASTLKNVVIEKVPAGALKSNVMILSADLASPAPPSK